MLKRLSVALAALFVLAAPCFGAGTIPYSLSQQFDKFGHVLAGCKLNLIQAGTVGTPQVAYQDTALTIPVPGGSQVTCDAAGRLPQFFLADGNIKILLTDVNGVTQVTADNILVIGNSSGGGGGGTVDPTTVLATGDFKQSYGTGNLAGFVRANGRTIGSSSSGATERATADCQALFQYLWGVDVSLVVSGGRGVSAAADWAANKTITLPDTRSRALASLGGMGNVDNGILSAATFTTGNALALGSTVGVARQSLSLAQLPTGITSSGSNNITVSPSSGFILRSGTSGIFDFNNPGGSGLRAPDNTATMSTTQTFNGSNNIAVTSNNTSGAGIDTVSPFFTVTTYIKL